MESKPKYSCDLHCHTILSDGNDSYQEIIQKAVELQMKVLAITDHDVKPLAQIEADGKRVSPEEYGRSLGIHILPGIEYSCDTYVDDVHIVGLGCDWTYPDFLIEEKKMVRSKMAGYRRLTEVLSAHGIDITWEELLENGGQPRQPEEIQRKHIFETIAAKGYTATWQEAKILVRDNPVFNVRREKIDPFRAVEVIHTAGGIAILAHPYLIDEEVETRKGSMSRRAYIEQLIDAGLDGIEASYTYDKTSYKGNQTPEAIEAEVRRLYGPRVKVISGGSDYHNDAKKGTISARRIGEKGVTWEYFRSNESLCSLIKA